MKPIRGTKLNLAHPLSRGLFNAWLFNEGGGNKVYDCIEGRVADLVNSVTWQYGKAGHGLRFGGNGDYIQLATDAPRYNAAAGFSWTTRMMFWQLPSASGANGYGPAYQVAAGYAWTLYGASATNTFRATIRDAAANNTTSGPLGTIIVGKWFDIAAVFDGSTFSFYVNGAYVSALTPGSILAGSGVILRWGLASTQSPTANAEYFVAWNRALRPSEARYVTTRPYCMFEQRFPAAAHIHCPAYRTVGIPQGLYALLHADSTLRTTLTGIFPIRAPQGVKPPYIVYEQADLEPEYAFDGPAGIVQRQYTLTCYHTSYAAAHDLAAHVRDLLSGYQETLDAEAELHHSADWLDTTNISGIFVNGQSDTLDTRPGADSMTLYGARLSLAVWHRE